MRSLSFGGILLIGAAALVLALEVLVPLLVVGFPLLINKYRKRRNPMYNIDFVSNRLASLVQQGYGKPDIVRNISKLCEGWPYVFAAWGEKCTPANRRRRVRDDHPTIVSACPVLSGKKAACAGCKWDLPVRMFDCRGFTDWVLNQVGIDLQGGGCTSQWNTKENWAVQGPIADMPRDRVCCVFTGTEKTKEHTGLYLGDGSTCECSSNVQFFGKMKSKWKYYAIPVGLYDDLPAAGQAAGPGDGAVRSDSRPTVRKGSTGPVVKQLQEELIARGYDCGPTGADSIFGKNTEAAVKRFQQDNGLIVDGVCGPITWGKLNSQLAVESVTEQSPSEYPETETSYEKNQAETVQTSADTPAAPEPDNQSTILYTVHIPLLPQYQAEALVARYSGAWMSKGA